MTELISYAYAVARDADGSLEAELSGLPGVADAPVRLVRTGDDADVVVAVSAVPAADFDERALRAHLEDLDWLEAVARAHHRVIEALAARSTVLPLRLATVYVDDESVRLMLADRRRAFADRLTELAAQTEWGVKIYVDAAAAETPEEPPAEDVSPGRAYLSRRRAQRHARQDAYRHAEEAARRVEDTARTYAVDQVRHRAQQGELAQGPGENVVNDAYLVPQQDADDFRADVLRAGEGFPGVRVEVTGPWAPYSFAVPAEADPVRRAAP
ncbi:gas vesicle protein [Streptomyces nigrescens]|uniref:Gas vesicle protein n=2 Tax=Streptomyces TaxID=1883 RepID=A0ABN6QRG5_STRNI|nr:GvpL/GvpF family gas vesicle protein [Streptomyces nigrescens]MEE4419775.1 GvpL/GvpF family gas vesicle protein [Streptomyces sp. DSM 41528]BDM68797.1 gas vesicle protein [Streptomyces nigrescens]